VGFFGDVGNFFGMGLGTSSYQTDPSKFQLPGMQDTQGQSQQGVTNAYGNQYNALHQGAPTIDQSGSSQWRGQQGQLAGMLFNQANGLGPNMGQMQLQSATDQNIRNAMALGQSMPGQNNMAAYRNILDNQAQAQQQAAGQSALLQAQTQQAAEGQLQGLLSGARSQDIGLAQNQAQLSQNQFGMNQNAAQGWGGQALGWANMQQGANQAQMQGNIAQQQIAANAYQNQANRAQSTTGGLLNGAASAITGGLLAHGGEVPRYAGGGGVGLGYFGLGMPDVTASSAPLIKSPMGGGQKPSGAVSGTTADGADVTVAPVDTSSMAATAIPDALPLLAMANGGTISFLGGGHVPGRAGVDGVSYKNDSVAA
jgi:hypothetical protein